MWKATVTVSTKNNATEHHMELLQTHQKTPNKSNLPLLIGSTFCNSLDTLHRLFLTTYFSVENKNTYLKRK